MVKKDFARLIKEKTDGEVTLKNIEAVLDVFSDVVIESLKNDKKDKITIPNLGSFKMKEVSAKDGKSALTGEPWHVDAHDEIYFSVNDKCKRL